jgi:addiction module HigA family antidote
MAMKKPPHPGRLVKDNIEELGLSVAAAAEGLGVTRQQLYKVIKGESAVSPEMAVRLEKAIGGTADAWLRMQAAYDLAQVRLREDAIKVRRLEARSAQAEWHGLTDGLLPRIMSARGGTGSATPKRAFGF